MKFNFKNDMLAKSVKFLSLAAIFLSTFSIFGHGMDEGHVTELIQGSPLDFIPVGAIHMVTGYDHILFLIGVIFFLTSVKDILKFITVFTLGHSITLIGATFLGWQMNYFLIDAVIGFSVFYKGFENLDGFKKYLKTDSPNLLLMVFAFGLIHGFGLSTRLQSLNIGDSLNLASIVSFNIGVELGQVAALIPILLLINLFRKADSFSYFEKATNWFLVAAGVALVIFQLYGFFTTPIENQPAKHQIEAEPETTQPQQEKAPSTHDDHHHDKGHSHGDGAHHHH